MNVNVNDFINTVDVLGEQTVEDLYLTGELTEFADIRIKGIRRENALGYIPTLKKASLPLISGSSTEQGIFYGCTSLEFVDVPEYEGVTYGAFENCAALEKVHLPHFKWMAQTVFKGAASLTALILSNKLHVGSLGSTNCFTGTPIEAGTGYIYVPKTMADGSDGVAAYSSATNWSAHATQIRAIEDYPDIKAIVDDYLANRPG